MELTSNVECGEILAFQNSLNRMRQIDDKIIYMLNTSIPTESFKGQVNPSNTCKDLFEQIQTQHRKRDFVIKKCLSSVQNRIEELKKKKDDGNSDPIISKKLKKGLSERGVFETELGIEEVIKNRTIKIFYEKCRGFYKPEKVSV